MPNVTNRYFRGQGSVYIGSRSATGRPVSLRPVGNVPQLQLSTSKNFTDHMENETGDNRIDLRISTQTMVTATMTLENINKENLMLAFNGSTTAVSGATVSAESRTAYKGRAFPLAKANITSFTSLTSDPAGTTYVAGTDYVITPPSNIVFIPTTSAIADAAAVLANYVAGASEIVNAFNATSEDFYLYFDGLNTVDSKKPVIVELFKCSFDPAAQTDLIGDNLVSLELQTTVLYDALNDSATADFGGFFRITQNQPA